MGAEWGASLVMATWSHVPAALWAGGPLQFGDDARHSAHALADGADRVQIGDKGACGPIRPLTDPRNHAVLIYLHTLTSGLCIRFGHLAPESPLRKALSVEEAGGGAAGGVGELIGGGQEGGVTAGDAVGELVGVVLDPHGVGAGRQGAQESGGGAQQ